MRRALIFRYDSARPARAGGGAHGLNLEQFDDAHVTVESAPIAAQSLSEDRVIEIAGDMTGQFPEEYASMFPEPVRLVCAPMAAAGPRDGRDLRRPAADRAAARRRRAVPAVDARQGGGARLGRPDRGQAGRGGAAARAADRSRARHPRGRDPAPVRGLDGARRRRRSAGGGSPAVRERDPGGAHRSARGAPAPARPLARGRRRRRSWPRSNGSRACTPTSA